MNITRSDIISAVVSATETRMKRTDVARLYRHYDRYVSAVLAVLKGGTWTRHLRYRQLTKVNNNGKVRHINSPDLTTLILQHLANHLIVPLYERKDPGIGLNCKPGHGITANVKRLSVVKRLKHIYYDRRDLNYAVIIDQRRCYEHIRPQMLRRALKDFTSDRQLIDYVVSVTFCGRIFPVGTPSSPVMHHVILYAFDRWLQQVCPMAVRYADDVFLPFATKEEAQRAKWRVKQFWWYTYGLRAKGFTQRVVSLSLPSDFCGYVLHRNNNKTINQHDKGYTSLRRSTYLSALKCRTSESYASYFGLMRHADMYSVMLNIENGNMELKQLTQKIRVNRKLDAENIEMRELAASGVEFTIYDYEIRLDPHGTPNWIKCLIGIPEVDKITGEATGRILAREYHGGARAIVDFHIACEREYDKRDLLPLTGVVMQQKCGYIYKNSTNMLDYIN